MKEIGKIFSPKKKKNIFLSAAKSMKNLKKKLH